MLLLFELLQPSLLITSGRGSARLYYLVPALFCALLRSPPLMLLLFELLPSSLLILFVSAVNVAVTANAGETGGTFPC